MILSDVDFSLERGNYYSRRIGWGGEEDACAWAVDWYSFWTCVYCILRFAAVRPIEKKEGIFEVFWCFGCWRILVAFLLQ